MGYYHQDAKELLGFDNMEEAPKDWNADILQEYELNSCCKCSRICHTEDELVWLQWDYDWLIRNHPSASKKLNLIEYTAVCFFCIEELETATTNDD